MSQCSQDDIERIYRTLLDLQQQVRQSKERERELTKELLGITSQQPEQDREEQGARKKGGGANKGRNLTSNFRMSAGPEEEWAGTHKANDKDNESGDEDDSQHSGTPTEDLDRLLPDMNPIPSASDVKLVTLRGTLQEHQP